MSPRPVDASRAWCLVPTARAAAGVCGIVLCLAVLLHAGLAAQVNIESLRRDEPPPGISGSLGGDLTVTTGNVNFVQIGVNGRLTHVRGNVTTLVIGDGGIGFLGGNRFSSSGLLHYRQTYGVNDWVDPEWYAQTNYDRPQLLEFRALVGSGLRTDFARGAWGTFGAGVAAMLEHERLGLPAQAIHDDRTTTIRNSTFLTLRVVPGEHLVVSSTTYAQPALTDFWGDVRVVENLSVAASVTERLDLTVTFDLRYDSEPPDGIAALDTRLRTGLAYTY